MAKVPVTSGLISAVSSDYRNSQLTLSLQREQGDWHQPNIYLSIHHKECYMAFHS